MSERIYLIPGLGADERVFQNLELPPSKVIEWIDPLPAERISDYAKRLIPQITNDNPILIGVSFGGMIALEMARLLKTEKVILISSGKPRLKIPSTLIEMIPDSILTRPNGLLRWAFGTTGANAKLLDQIINDSDPEFVKWALQVATNWTPPAQIKSAIRIHGTYDQIIPPRNATHLIKGGGHFMIMDRSEEISEILRSILQAEND